VGIGRPEGGAGLKLTNNNDVVPSLFRLLFPSWMSGFSFAAIAIGALVPAAVMSIGSANLLTRNFWKAYVRPEITPAGEAQVAKVTSLVVKLGALLAVIFLPTKFALDLQLLGGLWILQTFPALVFGLYLEWFQAPSLLAGWAVGLFGGTALAWADGLKPVHAVHLGSTTFSLYVGLLALVVNILIAVVVNLALPARRRVPEARLSLSGATDR
jgi:solute:Na+ symporter, SSS family